MPWKLQPNLQLKQKKTQKARKKAVSKVLRLATLMERSQKNESEEKDCL